MLHKAASLILVAILLVPVSASSIVAENEWENPGSGTSLVLDKIDLKFNLTPSCEFGITASSYASSAEHIDEIILDDVVEENGLISSELAASNQSIFVYYRAVGNVSFRLYLGLSGHMKGTVVDNNEDTIEWNVSWTSDDNATHVLKSSETGDDGGEYDYDRRYLLTYEKPDNAIGNSGIRRIDNIAVTAFSPGEKTPDIYQGVMTVTLVTF